MLCFIQKCDCALSDSWEMKLREEKVKIIDKYFNHIFDTLKIINLHPFTDYNSKIICVVFMVF